MVVSEQNPFTSVSLLHYKTFIVYGILIPTIILTLNLVVQVLYSVIADLSQVSETIVVWIPCLANTLWQLKM